MFAQTQLLLANLLSGAEEAATSPTTIEATGDGTLTTVTSGAQGMAAETMGSSSQALRESFAEAFNPLIALAPKFLAAVVILVLGYVIARILARVTSALCETIGFQTAAERSGLADSMQQVGITRGVPAIVGLIVFWLLMCVAIMAGFKVLGLAAVSNAMQEVVNYIPSLLVATVVIVVGLLVASLLRGVIATSADRVGISYAPQLAAGCYYILALITFLAAASHLGLAVELLEQMVLIAFGALAIGFGLAFGLGGRDVMGGILAGYYIRQRFQAGDHVQLGELEGTVREVGPVATIVETDQDGLTHRRSVPNHIMLKDGVR